MTAVAIQPRMTRDRAGRESAHHGFLSTTSRMIHDQERHGRHPIDDGAPEQAFIGLIGEY